ncbi:uncharacterized protein LOC9646305 [Selaginella moellendorffii]|uniref:uncharacterized protein LOC9646305 n=1 Tax=Selaginella moellendorffii TaxID=88036 RepID=UPI000D1C47B7|nr:uncharacterized protein LOC9646305 [Selaginella moellendorffii]|eukprot:XP_024530660.1 uncharacterized protein LOC9646305 [Selaginella moellendorffii]
MSEGAMEATAVNWGALDALVLDYCIAEELVVVEDDLVDDSSRGNVAARDAIRQIRSLIECGAITESVALLTKHASLLMQDQRFLFWLYKQHFIEILRGGGNAARLQAIECSRSQLGPCALNAYPEAYEEFKRVLLALIYDSDYQNSPVAEEWCEARRANLAATVASTLKAHMHADDPLFSLTICYLISVHNAYCMRKNLPLGDIASDILLKDRDPPPAFQDLSGEVQTFNEVDVQALAQAAELPRHDAIHSLRYTRGDVMAALKNELSRIRINTSILDKLVWEYCVYRGLINTSPEVSSSADSVASPSGRTTDAMDEDSSPRIGSGDTVCSRAEEADSSRSKNYRWKGRRSSKQQMAVVKADVEMVPAENSGTPDAAFEKYRRSVQIRQLITEKKIPEAIQEVEHLDPCFFENHPQLLFQMKQVAFCALIEAGDHSRALEIARVDLGPLAAKHADLLKPLKETVLSLARNPGEACSNQTPVAALAASVQMTLSASLGIREPQLMKLMRTCLFAHTEWFKVQMCSDPFADLLQINLLKEEEGAPSKVSAQKAESGSAEEQQQQQVPPQEKPPFEESAILTIMEWMALPRGDAIQLLVDYHGSVEEVFAQLMG